MHRLMMAGLALTAVAAAPPDLPVLRPHAVLRGHAGPVSCLAFRPDGKLLAAGSRGLDRKKPRRWGEIKLWDVANGKQRAMWEGHQDEPSALSFSPDGKTLVSVTPYREGTLWNVADGKAVRAFPARRLSGTVAEVRFSADGKRIGMSGEESAIVWDARSGQELFHHERKIRGWRSIMGHGLRLVASPNHQDVDLWDVRTGKLVRSLLDHRGGVQALSFSRDDGLLAVGCFRTTDDYEYVSEVWLWDVPGGQRKRTILLGNLGCHGVALSPSGDLLAVAGSLDLRGAPEIRLFATSSGDELARLRLSVELHGISPLAFRPDGQMLAAACSDGAVRLWAVQRPVAPGGPKRAPK
jgi:WD40 repeat protein